MDQFLEEHFPDPMPPLTDAEIDAVLAQLDHLEVEGEHLTLRQHVRQRYPAPVVVEAVCDALGLASEGARFTARCHDLSEGGLCMMTPIALDAGTRCAFTLAGTDGEPTHVTGVVCNAHRIHDGLYLCGVRFDELISPERFITARKAG